MPCVCVIIIKNNERDVAEWKGRNLGQKSLIVTGQPLGLGDRFRTGASNRDHSGRQNTATDNWWGYSYSFSTVKFNSVFRVS